MTELYEDIYEYLESIDDRKAVTEKDQDELIHKIHAHIDLDKKTCGIIMKYIFHEIRGIMLRGDCAIIRDLGKFLISGKHTDGKTYILPKFLPNKNLMDKLNHDR